MKMDLNSDGKNTSETIIQTSLYGEIFKDSSLSSGENLFALNNNSYSFDITTSANILILSQNISSNGIPEELQPVLIFCILIFFCMATVFGNALVIISIYREASLHSPTNYFIASLACADFLLGSVVMTFEAITELQGKRWIFGEIWCDLWHALDVLLATASILNLCVISLDRYWAISEPFSYPSKMNDKTSAKLIAAVWICSSLISLPAILWWKFIRGDTPFPDDSCPFTGDTTYLLTSSTISFYIPLVIMLFTYFRIYRAAVRQTRSIKLGSKFYYDKEMEVKMKMRIHRGGLGRASFAGRGELGALSLSSPDVLQQLQGKNSNGRNGSDSSYIAAAVAGARGNSAPTDSLLSAVNSVIATPVRVNLKPANRGSFIKRKFAKFSKEKKAAKTLFIVLGVFILCWMPFFIINLAAGFCPSCQFQEHILFNVFTWLGWVNSGMNPIIYAAWNRDFRRAFGRILCFSSCCNKLEIPLPRITRRSTRK